jgi:flagellar biosynthesis/type III secretory pathway protein FliH
MEERRRSPVPPSAPPPPPADSDVEQRLANLERELREKAAAAREKAQRAAREAAANYKRPSDEELGYIKTDDSIGKILADAREDFSRRLGDVRDEPVKERAADLLDDLASWLKADHGSDHDRKP